MCGRPAVSKGRSAGQGVPICPAHINCSCPMPPGVPIVGIEQAALTMRRDTRPRARGRHGDRGPKGFPVEIPLPIAHVARSTEFTEDTKHLLSWPVDHSEGHWWGTEPTLAFLRSQRVLRLQENPSAAAAWQARLAMRAEQSRCRCRLVVSVSVPAVQAADAQAEIVAAGHFMSANRFKHAKVGGSHMVEVRWRQWCKKQDRAGAR